MTGFQPRRYPDRVTEPRANDNLFTVGSIGLVPVIHGRLEFAVALHRAWDEFRPQAVALELPRSLSEPFSRTVDRLPSLSVVLAQMDDGVRFLLVEPTDPVAAAARRAQDEGLPWLPIDIDLAAYPQNEERWPDTYAVRKLGLAAFAWPFIDHPPPSGPDDGLREQYMASRLQDLARRHGRVLAVCGLAHAGRLIKLLASPQPTPLVRPLRVEAQPANLHPDSLAEVTSELPFVMRAYQAWLEDRTGAPPDRIALHERLYDQAAEAYEQVAGEEMPPWQRRVLRRFKRNWALVSGRLTADFYQLVVAAKGVGGDEFAYQTWKQAVEYPLQDPHPGWSLVRLTAADLGRDQRSVRFFKPLRRERRRLVPVPGRRERDEAFPGEWSEVWERGSGICSFPPEDLVIEDFGRRATRRALSRLAEANRFIEPFTASLRDGVDFRETIRRAADGRIWVYEERPVAGRVGAVVVVFDPDLKGEGDYPWLLSWLGEHLDESDMAFYATLPGQDLIGPGISRCRYGGLVMTYPSMRMIDIWRDPYFDPAPTKPDRLVMAGADYSREPTIAYIAAAPPSAWSRNIAARMGRRIAFLPLGLFAPAFLERIRTFHVLAGHDVRDWAGDYILGPGGFKGVSGGG